MEHSPRTSIGKTAPDAEGLPQTRAILGAVALGVLVLLVLPLVADAFRAYAVSWSFDPPVRADGRLVKVLATQGRNRMVNVSLAVAARWAANGRLQGLAVPEDLDTLDDLPPDLFLDEEVPAIQRGMIRFMVGGRLTTRSYDARIPTDVFDALITKGTVKEFPFHVYGVRRRGLPGVHLVSIADAGSNRIAVVPLGVNPIDTCMQPPPESIECPVAPEPGAPQLPLLANMPPLGN